MINTQTTCDILKREASTLDFGRPGPIDLAVVNLLPNSRVSSLPTAKKKINPHTLLTSTTTTKFSFPN